MALIEANPGPWRGVAFTPVDGAVGWRFSGQPTLGGESQGAFLLIDAPLQPPTSPKPFTLRAVTTREAGAAYVFAGEMFGRVGEMWPGEDIVAVQITLEPGAEVAFLVDEANEHALIAADGEVALNRTQIPARAAGLIGAGRTHLGVENLSERVVHTLLIGGPAAS